MLNVPIPAWNAQGVLPAVDALNPTSSQRSPYSVSLEDFISRFSTSKSRTTILEGFLDYREALHKIGLIQGFQWIDGSFLENVEKIRLRPPDDIDMTTFFHLPQGVANQLELLQRDPSLFNRDKKVLKNRFRVDASYVDLGELPENLIERSCYWYGVWSHQRDSYGWKGYVQINLDSTHDSKARTLLGNLVAKRTVP